MSPCYVSRFPKAPPTFPNLDLSFGLQRADNEQVGASDIRKQCAEFIGENDNVDPKSFTGSKLHQLFHIVNATRTQRVEVRTPLHLHYRGVRRRISHMGML